MKYSLKWIKKYARPIVKNAIPFLINLLFVTIFGKIFGPQNMLPAVAIGVGLTMLPLCNLTIKPLVASLIILILYIGCAFVGQLALISPFLALPINFLFVLLILLLMNEPNEMKPAISFLLCFIFCQSTKVAWNDFGVRLFGVTIGAMIVVVICLLFWKKKGYLKEGYTLKEQITRCNRNHRYLFRMSFGIAIAMFLGMILHLKKPLWISIVVMSLTQLEWKDTVERIKYRLVGNIIGIVIFFLVCQLLLPKEYALYFIIFLGYLGSFTTQYKYKQAINAISALNAALVLLDTKEAIVDRILLLLFGILIVLLLYVIAELLKMIKKGFQDQTIKKILLVRKEHTVS